MCVPVVKMASKERYMFKGAERKVCLCKRKRNENPQVAVKVCPRLAVGCMELLTDIMDFISIPKLIQLKEHARSEARRIFS
jgi:hypothetical protein